MFKHTVRNSYYGSSFTITPEKTYEGDVEVNINQAIAASAADYEVLVAVDVSTLKSIVLLATNDCTIKTNNSGTPTNTINLVAGVPYVWTIDSYNTNKLTADVSKIFITHGAGTEMTFSMLALSDA